MVATLKGDDAALRKLRAQMRRVAKAALVADVATQLAPVVERLARDSAEVSTNPYGQPWPDRTDGGAATLRGVVATLVARAAPKAVRITAQHPGVRIHQYGGTIVPKRADRLRFTVAGTVVFARKVRMPRRQYMPEADRGLPASWAEAFARVSDAALEKFFKD
jgi:hypothetical protein